MKEDIKDLRSELEAVKEQSLARELLIFQREQDAKRNKRMFIIILVILSMWFATGCYLVYVLNDIGTSKDEYTQEINDIVTLENTTIKNGGN